MRLTIIDNTLSQFKLPDTTTEWVDMDPLTAVNEGIDVVEIVTQLVQLGAMGQSLANDLTAKFLHCHEDLTYTSRHTNAEIIERYGADKYLTPEEASYALPLLLQLQAQLSREYADSISMNSIGKSGIPQFWTILTLNYQLVAEQSDQATVHPLSPRIIFDHLSERPAEARQSLLGDYRQRINEQIQAIEDKRQQESLFMVRHTDFQNPTTELGLLFASLSLLTMLEQQLPN